jgi:hypothetical protein
MFSAKDGLPQVEIEGMFGATKPFENVAAGRPSGL